MCAASPTNNINRLDCTNISNEYTKAENPLTTLSINKMLIISIEMQGTWQKQCYCLNVGEIADA